MRSTRSRSGPSASSAAPSRSAARSRLAGLGRDRRQQRRLTAQDASRRGSDPRRARSGRCCHGRSRRSSPRCRRRPPRSPSRAGRRRTAARRREPAALAEALEHTDLLLGESREGARAVLRLRRLFEPSSTSGAASGLASPRRRPIAGSPAATAGSAGAAGSGSAGGGAGALPSAARPAPRRRSAGDARAVDEEGRRPSAPLAWALTMSSRTRAANSAVPRSRRSARGRGRAPGRLDEISRPSVLVRVELVVHARKTRCAAAASAASAASSAPGSVAGEVPEHVPSSSPNARGPGRTPPSRPGTTGSVVAVPDQLERRADRAADVVALGGDGGQHHHRRVLVLVGGARAARKTAQPDSATSSEAQSTPSRPRPAARVPRTRGRRRTARP